MPCMNERNALQQELLRFLRPFSRRIEQQPGERVRPRLAEIGRTHAGRPVEEVVDALEQAIREAGAEPHERAVREFAEQIRQGENPFD